MAISKTGCSKSITKADIDFAYKNGVAVGVISELKNFRRKLIERCEDLEVEYTISGHNAICNRISELHEIIFMVENRVYELSPEDCDWMEVLNEFRI